MTQPPPPHQPEPPRVYSDAGSGETPYHPQPRKPRWPLWVAIGCGLLTLLLLLTAGGVALWLSTRPDDIRVYTTDTEAPADTGTPADDDPSDDPTDEPDGEPADDDLITPGADGPGSSRGEPAPVGSTVVMPTDAEGSFEITFGTPDQDAEQAVLDASPSNEPAPEGQSYVMVPVTVTYHGEEPAEYWSIVGVDYVDSTGTVHRVARGVTPPRTSHAMGTFHDGNSAEHDLVFLVPNDALGDGVADVHLVFTDADPDTRVYVELA